jgi:hypothetical protein
LKRIVFYKQDSALSWRVEIGGGAGHQRSARRAALAGAGAAPILTILIGEPRVGRLLAGTPGQGGGLVLMCFRQSDTRTPRRRYAAENLSEIRQISVPDVAPEQQPGRGGLGAELEMRRCLFGKPSSPYGKMARSPKTEAIHNVFS